MMRSRDLRQTFLLDDCYIEDLTEKRDAKAGYSHLQQAFPTDCWIVLARAAPRSRRRNLIFGGSSNLVGIYRVQGTVKRLRLQSPNFHEAKGRRTQMAALPLELHGVQEGLLGTLNSRKQLSYAASSSSQVDKNEAKIMEEKLQKCLALKCQRPIQAKSKLSHN